MTIEFLREGREETEETEPCCDWQSAFLKNLISQTHVCDDLKNCEHDGAWNDKCLMSQFSGQMMLAACFLSGMLQV